MARMKIVDTWDIRVRTDEDATVRFNVPCRLDKKDERNVQFHVDFEYGEFRFFEWDKDINSLRKKVEAWLKNVVTYKWEDFFYIEFSGCDENKAWSRLREDDVFTRHASTHFSFRQYQIATDANGKKVYRDLSKRLNGGAVIQGEPDIGLEKDSFRRDGDTMKALVPKTPETEAALNSIANGFASLTEKLRTLLHPDLVMETLATVDVALVRLPLIATGEKQNA